MENIDKDNRIADIKAKNRCSRLTMSMFSIVKKESRREEVLLEKLIKLKAILDQAR